MFVGRRPKGTGTHSVRLWNDRWELPSEHPKGEMLSTQANKSIGRKILAGSLLTALPPLILLAIAVVIGIQNLSNDATVRVAESRDTLSEETVVLGSQDQAISIGREINVVLRERVSDVAAWARSAEIVDAAKSAAAEADAIGLVDDPVEELESTYERFRVLRQFGAITAYLDGELEANTDFGQVAFTDANGFNVAASSRPEDFVQSDEAWWQDAVQNGLSLSDVEYDATSDIFSVDIAVRIDDPGTARMVGVIETSLSISFVQAITTDRALENVDYAIALADGRLIADTSSEHAQIRMMSFSFAGGAASPGVGAAIAADLDPGQSATIITDDTVFGYTSTLAEEPFDIGVGEFEGFDWIVVSSQPTEIAFAPLAGLEALSADISQSGRNLALIAAAMLIGGLVVATLLARRLTRQIVEPVQALTNAASEAASTGLPGAVYEINENGANAADVAPPTVEIKTNDELQTLAGAFNSVQAAALRLAGEQATSRRNTTEMFVNLGRRNQSLLKRQLRFIDTLEANEQDPDTLESLFKLDHLATRMRRNAESLLVLAGDRSPRRWAEPIDVQSAIEAALAEVESYERVDFGLVEGGKIQGNIVADVAHILAEVIENGLNFSPPTTQVAIVGRNAGERYIIAITDEGLGMKQDEIDRINNQLATVIEITDVPSQQLGLFVVARLASRHGIDVHLTNAATGGLAVRIEIPMAEQRVEETSPAVTAGDAHSSAASDLADSVAGLDAADLDNEVKELLSKAEAAAAKAAAIRADRSQDDLAEEEARLAELQRNVRAVSVPVAPSVEPVAPADVPPASVDVGDSSFPRRTTTADRGSASASTVDQHRPVEAVAPVQEPTAPEPIVTSEVPADVEAFGFKRRESKRAPKTAEPGRRKSDNAPATGASNDGAGKAAAGDVHEVAEKSRNQWGSFQRGKSDAANVSVAPTDSAAPPADAADNSAETKEN